MKLAPSLKPPMKIISSTPVATTTATTTTIAASTIFRSQSPYSFSPSSGPNKSVTTSNLSSPIMQDNVTFQNLPSKVNEENKILEDTLRKAVMKDNKTVIMTTLNAAWTQPNSIFDLFIESFKIGNGTEKLLRHVVVATLDQKAHSRCLKARFLHCYALTTQGVDFSGEAFFMSEDYLKMMWRRIDFLTTVLQMGFDFVFTDADVMWLRDPFKKFYQDVDFQIACHYYSFNSTDRNNLPNGGFNYVRSNNRTVRFYKFWYESRERFPGQHDQDVLNIIKFDPFIQDIGLGIRFLDTAYFGGFCEPSEDLDLVVTMHANCCFGLGNKVHDIRMVIDDWKKYLSLSSSGRNLSNRSWTVPRICG
ncbi:Nucleotide-diphospho-sugar transferase family protein [Striga hermonthica]|uniref:Nucleotide-diphospho-sugar transferase family protein n=1 Tax=Striga hermonthica TaxID=68872 RepID=A0A9N7NKW0_STRHE|nr:Nucleotide-diphospho-sugar transferase family protein [Striga hermonthica]